MILWLGPKPCGSYTHSRYAVLDQSSNICILQFHHLWNYTFEDLHRVCEKLWNSGFKRHQKPDNKDLHLFDCVLPRIYVSTSSNFKGSSGRGTKNPDSRHDKRLGKKDAYNRLATWYSLDFCLDVPKIWQTHAQGSWTQGNLSPSCS